MINHRCLRSTTNLQETQIAFIKDGKKKIRKKKKESIMNRYKHMFAFLYMVFSFYSKLVEVGRLLNTYTCLLNVIAINLAMMTNYDGESCQPHMVPQCFF